MGSSASTQGELTLAQMQGHGNPNSHGSSSGSTTTQASPVVVKFDKNIQKPTGYHPISILFFEKP